MFRGQIKWDFFKTAEEKERQKELERRIGELDRFTGSLSEYNALKNEDYMIMDTGRARKFVRIDIDSEDSLLQNLISQGCTGVIRYIPPFGTNLAPCGGYYLPVKKK